MPQSKVSPRPRLKGSRSGDAEGATYHSWITDGLIERQSSIWLTTMNGTKQLGGLLGLLETLWLLCSFDPLEGVFWTGAFDDPA